MIRLGELLKLAGVVGSGGEAKALLASTEVLRQRRAGEPARAAAARRRRGPPRRRRAARQPPSRAAAPADDPDQPLLREGALGARARRDRLRRGAPRAGHATAIVSRRAGGHGTLPVLICEDGCWPSPRRSCAGPTPGCRRRRACSRTATPRSRDCAGGSTTASAPTRAGSCTRTCSRTGAHAALQRRGRAGVGGPGDARPVAGRDALGGARAGNRHRHGGAGHAARAGRLRRDRRAAGATDAATCAATASRPPT